MTISAPIAAAPLLELPVPADEPGMTLFEALRQRRTIRDMSPAELEPQQLSNLLWAAWGVNRLRGPFGAPGRTAGSASNSQEIDLYVALSSGVYLFEAVGHRLRRVCGDDLRARAMTPGQQGVTAQAPVQLIFVADLRRLEHTQGFDEPRLHDPEMQKAYYYVDTGLIAGNVQLYAAAHGLAAWFHNCDRAALARLLGLDVRQRVLFAQSVGFPAEA